MATIRYAKNYKPSSRAMGGTIPKEEAFVNGLKEESERRKKEEQKKSSQTQSKPSQKATSSHSSSQKSTSPNTTRNTVGEEVDYAKSQLNKLSSDERKSLDKVTSGNKMLSALQGLGAVNNRNNQFGLQTQFQSKAIEEKKKGEEEFKKKTGYDEKTYQKYVQYAREVSNYDDRKKQQEQIKKDTTEGNFITNKIARDTMDMADIIMSPFAGASAAAEGMLGKYAYADQNAPVDTNSANYMMQNYATDVEKARTDYLNEGNGTIGKVGKAFGKDLGNVDSFLYGTGMSMGKAALSMAIGGSVAEGLGLGAEAVNAAKAAGNFKKAQQIEKAASAVSNLVTLPQFGTSSYATTLQEAQDRGLSQDQAQATALVAGAAEMAFEKLSVEHFWEIYKNSGAKAARKAIVNVLAQSGIEGLEEVATDVANAIADDIINKGESENKLNYQKYIDNGDSESEAKKKAAIDFGKQIGQDFLGGAISGAVFGGFGVSANHHQNVQGANAEFGVVGEDGKVNYTGEQAAENYAQIRDAIPDVGNKNQSRIGSEAKQTADLLRIKAQNNIEITQDERTDLYQMEQYLNDQYAKDEKYRQAVQEYHKANATQGVSQTLTDLNTVLDNPIQTVGSNEQQVNATLVELETPEKFRAKSDVNIEDAISNINNANNVEELANAYNEAKASARTPQDNGIIENLMNSRKQKMNVTNEDLENVMTLDKAYQIGVRNEELTTDNAFVREAYNEGKANRLAQNSPKTATARANGKEFTIDKIKNVKGETYVTTNEGETVPLSVVSFANPEMYNVYGEASLSANPQAFIDGYTEISDRDITLEAYSNTLENVYNYARLHGADGSFEKAIKNEAFANLIPESTLKSMYNEGLKDTKTREKKLTKTGKKAEKKVIDENQNLSKNGRKLMKAIADKLGVDVEIVDNEIIVDGEKFNGIFNPSENKITLNANGKNVFKTLIHEVLGEMSEAYSSEKMNELQLAIIDWNLAHNPKDFNDTVKAYRQAYIDVEGAKSYREAADEYVNDILVELFNDEQGMKDFANFIADKQSVKETFLEFIDNIVSAIKELMGDNTNSRFKDDIETMQRLRKMALDTWQTAIDNKFALENGETELKQASSLDVRNSIEPGTLEQKAIKHFGTTENFRTAGYILQDGTMLDFSGAHWLEGESPEYIADWKSKNDIRQVDHEDIYEVMEASGDNRKQFMDRGNIRISPEAPGINISATVEPTPAQYRQIKEFIREVKKNPYYDATRFFLDLEGDKPNKVTYSNNLNEDRVVSDIKRFYETGELTTTAEHDFRFSLGGFSAYTADTKAAKEAQDLLKDGKTPEEVFKTTGWYKGVDGKWRFEISNKDSSISKEGFAKFFNEPEFIKMKEVEKEWMEASNDITTPERKKRFLDLGDEYEKLLSQYTKKAGNKEDFRLNNILYNDELFKAYPSLERVHVKFGIINGKPSVKGAWVSSEQTIVLNPSLVFPNDIRKTLLHEVQHAIQWIEGFAEGSSEEFWKEYGASEYLDSRDVAEHERKTEVYNSLLENAPKDFTNRYEEYSTLMKAYGGLAQNDESLYEKANSIYKELKNDYPDLLDAVEDASWEMDMSEPYPREMIPYEAYYYTAGEIEAREVSERADMTDEERRNNLPKMKGDNGKVFFAENPENPTDNPDIRYSIELPDGREVDNLSDVLDMAEHRQFMGEINNHNKNKYQRAKNGDVIVPIENKLVYTDFNYNDPGISQIILFNTNDYTEIDGATNLVYKSEKGEITHEQMWRTIENAIGEGNIRQYDGKMFGTVAKYDRQTERGQSRSDSYHAKKQQERKRFSIKVETLDSDYKDAVENGKEEEAKRLIKIAADQAYPDTKGRYEDGTIREFYHGTNSDEFNEFDSKMIGTANDSGYFGRGFYFAFNKGEARMYGSNVIPAYLNTVNPYYISDLYKWNGKDVRDLDGDFNDIAFAMNFAREFPEYANDIKFAIYDENGNPIDYSFEQFEKDVNEIANNKKFVVSEKQGDYGPYYEVETDKQSENGYEWYDYSKAYADEGSANDEILRAYHYLLETKYNDTFVTRPRTIIMDHPLSETLQQRGYDSIYQSENGDEVVVFNSSQVGRSDITYDDNGNLIPPSERFNTDNDDIRFSIKVEDKQFDDIKKRAKRYSMYDAWEELEDAGLVGNYNKVADDTMAQILDSVNNLFKGQEIGANSIKTVAKEIKEYTGSTINTATLEDELDMLFNHMQREDNQLNMDEMFDLFKVVARDVVKKMPSESVDDEFRSYVKSLKISLTDTQKEEVAHVYGSYNEFRQRNMGNLTITNDGMTLDELWNEIADQSNFGLSDNVSEAEQPLVLVDYLNALKEQPLNNYGASMDELATDTAIRILEKYYAAEQQALTNKALLDNPSAKKALDDARANMRKADQEFRKQVKEKYDAEVERLTKEREDAINSSQFFYKRTKDLESQLANASSEADKEEIRKLKSQLDRKDKALIKAQAKAKQPLTEYQEQLGRKEEKRKIMQISNRLMKMVYAPTEKLHMPEEFRKPIGEFLNGIDFITHRGDLDSIDKLRWQTRMDNLRHYLSELSSKPNATQNELNLAELLEDELLEDMEKFTRDHAEDKKISRMSKEDLHTLYGILTRLSATVSKTNETFANSVYADMTKLNSDSLDEMKELRDPKINSGLLQSIKDFFGKNLEDPITYFSLLGNAPKTLFDGFLQGFDIRTGYIKDAQEYTQSFLPENVYKWEKDSHTFNLKEGELKLSTAQIMTLYETVKRKNARLHNRKGGFKTKNYDLLGKVVISPKAAHLTDSEYKEIFGVLTPEQIEIADKLQWFMANTCADWGNKVSMKAWGYKKFTEKDYFPMQVAPDSRAASNKDLNTKNLYANKNMSASKELKEMASNPLVIDSIFNVFTEHVADMATYGGMVLPQMDAMRWFNYKVTEVDSQDRAYYEGTQQEIGRLYGLAGTNYFLDLIAGINGAEPKARGINIQNALIGHYKKVAVMAKIRVAIQQPTSFVRAYAEMDGKYLTKALATTNPAKYSKIAQANSMLAWWKAQGYYESYIGKGLKEMIVGKNPFLQKVDDFQGWGAQTADNLTLGVLYHASELEVKDKHPDLKGKEFTDAVVERFEDLVSKTQVVDTMLHRTDIMRRQDSLVKVATSFMTEPLKTYNMLLRAFVGVGRDRNKETVQKLIRVLFVWLLNNAILSAVTTAWDAFRKDDDKTPYAERFLSMYPDEFKDNINPVNMIPFVKDVIDTVVDVVEGNYFAKTDMSTDAFRKAATFGVHLYKAVHGEKVTVSNYGLVKEGAQAISYLAGIPAINVWNDIEGIHNGLFKNWETKAPSEYQKLYDAFENDGDIQQEVKNLLAAGKDEITVKKQITSTYKQTYLDTTDLTEKANLKNKLIKAYTAAGDDREKAIKKIDKW